MNWLVKLGGESWHVFVAVVVGALAGVVSGVVVAFVAAGVVVLLR